jgi:membrane protein
MLAYPSQEQRNVILTPISSVGRLVALARRQFAADNCGARAAALTFSSLLAVVPLLAVGFALLQRCRPSTKRSAWQRAS